MASIRKVCNEITRRKQKILISLTLVVALCYTIIFYTAYSERRDSSNLYHAHDNETLGKLSQTLPIVDKINLNEAGNRQNYTSTNVTLHVTETSHSNDNDDFDNSQNYTFTTNLGLFAEQLLFERLHNVVQSLKDIALMLNASFNVNYNIKRMVNLNELYRMTSIISTTAQALQLSAAFLGFNISTSSPNSSFSDVSKITSPGSSSSFAANVPYADKQQCELEESFLTISRRLESAWANSPNIRKDFQRTVNERTDKSFLEMESKNQLRLDNWLRETLHKNMHITIFCALFFSNQNRLKILKDAWSLKNDENAYHQPHYDIYFSFLNQSEHAVGDLLTFRQDFDWYVVSRDTTVLYFQNIVVLLANESNTNLGVHHANSTIALFSQNTLKHFVSRNCTKVMANLANIPDMLRCANISSIPMDGLYSYHPQEIVLKLLNRELNGNHITGNMLALPLCFGNISEETVLGRYYESRFSRLF